MTEQRLEPGSAATLAHNTLSAQINALISCATGAVKAQAEGLQMLLNSNMAMIIEASNNQVDELNSLIDQLEHRDDELSKAQRIAIDMKRELDALRSGRQDDERRVMSIMTMHDQVKSQRDAYKRDSDENGKLRAEIKRLKAQAERNAESRVKMEVELTKARQQTSEQRRHLISITDCVQRCNKLMRFTRDTLIFEGLASEVIFEHEGETYHIYRKPSQVATYWQPLVDGKTVSRSHQFMMRVETTSGYHLDVIPLESGDLHIVKPKALPAGIKAYLKEQFAATSMFDHESIKMRSDALTDRLNEISDTITPLAAMLHEMERKLIKEKVIATSKVNSNKNKRRAA